MRFTSARFVPVLAALALGSCNNSMPAAQSGESTAAPSGAAPSSTDKPTVANAAAAAGSTAPVATNTGVMRDSARGGAPAPAANGGAMANVMSPGEAGSAGMAQVGAAGGSAAAGSDGAAGAAGMSSVSETGGAFEQCVAALKPMCGYDQKMVACSSLMTAAIPLTSGDTWGSNEIKGGPYGAFVEWNQGMAFANPVNASESTCDVLAASFGEPAEVTADVLDLRGGDLALYTIFRPACMHEAETFPVITWGNGTCGQSGGYASLLATLASHGFVVIAANSRFTDAGNMEMLRALDLAKALNEQQDSVLYQRLDLDKIGAMGHSQGSSATANASSDPRIKALILWNGGLSVDTKPFLAVSGDRDIGGYTPAQMDSAVQGSSLPAAFLYYHQILETGGNVTGHLTLMEQPERVWEPTVAWWKYMLQGDEEAKKMFLGADCGLCNKMAEYEFGANPNLK